MIIDSHIHLNAPDYQENLEELLAEAQEQSVEKFICVGAGYGSESASQAVELADKYDCIYASIGIHPLDAHNPYDQDVIQDLAKHPKVVAIGETGFDYYHRDDCKEQQRVAFTWQIELAKESNKPLIIHARSKTSEAAADCLALLTEMAAQEVGGVFHCYGENAEFAKQLAEINFMVSFPGIITFKNAESVQQAAKEIPIEQIMIETDGPYLAPTPYRGKLCRPAYIVETAKTLAEVRGLSTPECNKQIYDNTVKFYNLPNNN